MAENIQFIEKTLKELCVNIGERPLGSSNNQRAQAYIGSLFQKHGYEVEYQGFDCMDWKGHDISLRIGEQSVPTVISPYSLHCDVKAESVLVGNLDELEAYDIKGKVVILHGELTREAIMPKNFKFWNPEEHQRIVHLLESKRPAALVTISFNEELATPIFEDGDFDIPTAVVSKKNGELLLRSPGTIFLKIVGERCPSRGANVIARKLGKAGGKKIVFSAHMDHVGTGAADAEGDSIFNGADDDASGTATVLEVAQAFASLPARPRRSMIFLTVSGEEKGLFGSAWFNDHPPVARDKIVANINLDMVGRNHPDTVVAIGQDYSSLGAAAQAVAKQRPELGLVVAPDLWPQENLFMRSDHFNFAKNGIPALFFTTGLHEQYHKQSDEVELIDRDKITRIARLVFHLALDVANTTESPKWTEAGREAVRAAVRATGGY